MKKRLICTLLSSLAISASANAANNNYKGSMQDENQNAPRLISWGCPR